MRKSTKIVGTVLFGGLASAAAIAMPWDVDMVDSQAFDGYRCWEFAEAEDGTKTCVKGMHDHPLPEGVISQANILTPNSHGTTLLPKFDQGWNAVVNPVPADEASLATGERMFNIYCTPCHGTPDANGKIAELGPVAQPGRMVGVVNLTGSASPLPKRTDGHVYRVIRLGNAIMPAHGWAMTDTEMWSVVHYVRTLDNGKYVPPAPPEGSADAAEESSK